MTPEQTEPRADSDVCVRYLEREVGEGVAVDVVPVAILKRPPDELLRLENPTTIVPGGRVAHLVYGVCTG